LISLWTALVRVTHDHPLYLICPDLLAAVGETSYRIQLGFIGSTCSLHHFVYVFICILGVKSTPIQLCAQKSYSHDRKETFPLETTPLFLLTKLYTTLLILLTYSATGDSHPIPLFAPNCFSHLNLSNQSPTIS
jgi:hypothetical protein